ncbi:HTH-type transcriptional activator ArnR [Pyrofollis japonicus]|uniref:winged helix-turn-helix domain-containing protein n=1 Tax=Pyrofollis japonicus TaxID=3060460 RepID=UPI00295AD5FF|nr:winged helix-turn-helix domain-containing protein [Pyrofollis japonicus]BEP18207.1 HTH-type transcriptional activator ArnR [Pyrofollis japonicus]
MTAIQQRQVEMLIERIDSIRELDSVIDLARGWLQIRILILLGAGEATVDSLMTRLSQPRKTILDALRKMRQKGLVEDNKGYYRLTEKGQRLFRIILGLNSNGLNSPSTVRCRSTTDGATPYDIIAKTTRYLYLYEALMALGSSPSMELSIETLSSILRLSPRQLDDYLSVYANGALKILKRSIKQCGVLRKRTCVYYRLNNNGLKILHKLPEYTRIKRSLSNRILVKITRTLHPRLVLKRITIALSVGSAIAMLLVLFKPELGVIILGSWVLFISFISLLIAKSY